MKINNQFINQSSKDWALSVFTEAIKTGLNFKLQENVRKGDMSQLDPADLIEEMPIQGMSITDIQEEFNNKFLPFSYNFAAPKFMGFPDAGNSIAAIAGNIVADFLQQNLINQSFCSPSGTFAEISVIRWLREVVGYCNSSNIKDIFDVGGVITGGGTASNTIGMLLARENYRPSTMSKGVSINEDFYIVIPKGIGHYSIKSAQMWVGCGNRLLEVETNNFRYNLTKLKKTLQDYKGRIMAVVAYAGDSRTMTVDHFDKIAKIVRSIDQNIWLHADACHGFSLGFSDKLKAKITGIELFDSITTDPHKVMNTPYAVSALLVKDPQKLRSVSSVSDLIMQEQFAFGQITPFLGSKPWLSLKLWFVLKNLGKEGFAKIIEDRHQRAIELADLINKDSDFILINKVDINAVAFMYTGSTNHNWSIEDLNNLNKDIHKRIISEGVYHLHQFSIPDSSGTILKDATIYPLRYMSGNPLIVKNDLNDMLNYVKFIALKILKEEKWQHFQNIK